jgi:hypothetical protein
MLLLEYFNYCVNLVNYFCVKPILLCSRSHYLYFGRGLTCRSFLDFAWLIDSDLSSRLLCDFYFEK